MLCQACPLRKTCKKPCDEIKTFLKSEKIKKTKAEKLNIPYYYSFLSHEDKPQPFVLARRKFDLLREVPKEKKIDLLRNFIMELPENEKQCLNLTFWHELPLHIIATCLDIPKGDIKKNIFNAFAHIQRRFHEHLAAQSLS